MKVFGNYGLKSLNNKQSNIQQPSWDCKSYMYDDDGYITGYNYTPRVYDIWLKYNSDKQIYIFYDDTLYRFKKHRNGINNYYYILFPTYHKLLGFTYKKWHYIVDPYHARNRGIYTKNDYPTRFKLRGSAYLLQVPFIEAGLSWLSQPQINLDYILTIAIFPCVHNMLNHRHIPRHTPR